MTLSTLWVGLGVHMGDAVQLNVERRSQIGHIKGLLVKTHVELLKLPHGRFRHDGLEQGLEGAARILGALKSTLSLTAEHFSELYHFAQAALPRPNTRAQRFFAFAARSAGKSTTRLRLTSRRQPCLPLSKSEGGTESADRLKVALVRARSV